MSEKRQLALIDGSGYIFRAFHALPPMNRSDGTPVNAVYGFTRMVMKLVDDLAPSHVAVIFDSSRKTFRTEIYQEYKANRDAPPEDLVPQFDLVRTATDALGLPRLEVPGFEADDLIATYAVLAAEKGLETIIVSSDKDLMQLVRPGVTMLDPMKQRRIAEAEVEERFGVLPNRVVDVQALAGDPTDNVPGVPGIGIKTAAELINRFGDLDTLLEKAGEITQPKRRENLQNHADKARLSRELVRLRIDVPTPCELDDLAHTPRDLDLLQEFLAAQEFKQLLARLRGGNDGDSGRGGATRSMGGTPGGRGGAPASRTGASRDGGASGAAGDVRPVRVPPGPETTCYRLITEIGQLEGVVEEARAQGLVAIDTETSSLNAARADLVGVAMALAPGRAFYVPLRHGAATHDKSGQSGLALEDAPTQGGEQIAFKEAMALLKPLLEDPSVLKIGHNLKYDAHVLMHKENGGVAIGPVDDTMCLSYVLDAGRIDRHSLDNLADRWLDHQTIKYEEVCGRGAKQVPFASIAPEAALDYAAEDADITLRLWRFLRPRLAGEGVTSVYERLERPLIPVLAAMENRGICVDTSILGRMSNDFAGRIKALQGEIIEMAGEEFNIASPRQLGEILFEKMGLPGGKRARTGAWSTTADILEELAAAGAKIATKVLDWRQLAKLKSTYADALQESINPKTGRVHTSFSMTGASTGRLSSSDPNVQNIPIRTAEGRQIRTAFVAAPGRRLISADYSQIELRLIAHVAREESMIEAFLEGVDIHARTASEVFGIPLNDMDAETRRRAKAINFGIIYGISGFGLARQLGISRGEANDYIDAYFRNFPGIRDYMERIKAEARDRGYVQTLFGRRIHITGLTGSSPAHRGFAERQAINAPIQGSAADIIKRAMVRLPPALEEKGVDAPMLLQVHDELIFEAREKDVDKATKVICSVMEGACAPVLELNVPLVAEAGSAASWAEAH